MFRNINKYDSNIFIPVPSAYDHPAPTLIYDKTAKP